jgi:pimeloyl-ACP methyl ester carboxylesterase
MDRFASYDGTEIAYRTLGTGQPLLCLPGGPGRASEYLGDLGGLAATRQLVLMDNRGTGGSADAEPETYRCDRVVADVDALRAHLGLGQMDLLAHSAAGDLGVLYAAAHPERLTHLALITPSLRAVGVQPSDEQQDAAIEARAGEPWYADARAALEKAEAGDQSMETRTGYAPFFYGRWDETARAHVHVGVSERSRAFRARFWTDGCPDTASTQAALRHLSAPVLILAGEADIVPPAAVKEAVGLFPQAQIMVQPRAGHFPWLDDPAWFTAAVTRFLG